MTEVMSACGVLCSGCAAFHGKAKGIAHQRRTATAWKRIYKMKAKAENLSCGGCQGLEDELLGYCKTCKAQQCCREKGFRSCSECAVEGCTLLEKAQAVWDGVPKLAQRLSRADFIKYAEPYCGHRERLERARQIGRNTAGAD